MKRLITKFLRFVGKTFGVSLHPEKVVLDLTKKFEIDKVITEKQLADKLIEITDERNIATRQLNRSQRDYANSLLARQKLQDKLGKCRAGDASVLWQDEALENSGENFKPIKERNTDVTISFTKINELAIAPTKFNENDAGYDLYCAKDSPLIIPPRSRAVADTGVAMDIPKGYYGRITTRASISWRDGVGVLSGLIDAGNRNTVKVILYNTTNESKHFEAGARLAQIIIEKAETVSWKEDKKAKKNRGRKIGSSGE